MLPSDLVKYKEKSQKIIALTAWDSISGSIAEQANVDLVLVGDSLAMVCLGYKSTLPLTLENIIYQIGTGEFVRMRLGIAEPSKETRPSEKYVLKPFNGDNQKKVDLMIQQSVDAMEYLLVNGLNQTMSKYNS